MTWADWKAGMQLLLNRAGYRVERLRPTSSDPFADQASLLARGGVAPIVVFDLGAHTGTTVAQYRKVFPDATIFAFEPSPESFAKLKAATHNDPAVKCFELAVSEENGSSRLHMFRHEQANSLLPITPQAGRYYDAGLFDDAGTASVATATLDRFCALEGVSQIDVLKMDVQGAALLVIRGATELLANGRVALIFTEVEFTEVYAGEGSFFDIRESLAGLGYDLFNLYGLYRGRDGRLVAADAIFLRRDLIEVRGDAGVFA